MLSCIREIAQYWEQVLQSERGAAMPWDLQQTLLAGLRLNVLEVNRYLHGSRPTLHQFEAWVLECNGGVIEEARLERLQRAMAGMAIGSEVGLLEGVEGLSESDLEQWDEHGYVVLKNAVTAQAAEAAELAIYEYLGMSAHDSESWYTEKLGHSIWVPLLRHPALVANRYAPRIVKAFAQLWGCEDLWATVDQGGLNPPVRPGWPFPGPHLHWDTTLAPPHHFGVQGILYLADVAENQGAFSCVPGFHKRLESWLKELPEGVDARKHALATLCMKPIAAQRGDMVIWHQSLPHGASPNTSARPRVAQYLSFRPTRWPYLEEWV
ncbi:phytanoyl-CoA dioxygenase family protein [Granulicella paludicola]|uniref:phytanoyl-CoA dioxygenase family protein n=1 Tax=Granulicella paludicola TaxID=474951 RepID=UPI0021E0107F|nr:phytanoyl-CoA dioxygenase family protein [Granulicella paludicola]